MDSLKCTYELASAWNKRIFISAGASVVSNNNPKAWIPPLSLVNVIVILLFPMNSQQLQRDDVVEGGL